MPNPIETHSEESAGRPEQTISMAQSRLAEDRTVLANERTYTAWMRTGLTALATGGAFERFIGDNMPLWATHAVATILIGFSICAFVLGIWHYTHLGIKLRDAEIRRLPIRTVIALTIALCGASVLALIGLIAL